VGGYESGGARDESASLWRRLLYQKVTLIGLSSRRAVQALRKHAGRRGEEQACVKIWRTKAYAIDTQIMVWGWDPQMTMTVRANQGYSWVPSYGQNNIAVGSRY